jgi:hypothetical protein
MTGLGQRLKELEASDPQVRAAAKHYDFVVWRLNRQAARRRAAAATPTEESQP